MPMRSGAVLVLGLLLAASALSGCSGDQDPTPHPQVRASDSPVRLVGPDDADLILYVSNQSFEDDNVSDGAHRMSPGLIVDCPHLVAGSA
jgi:hypothetical protein